MRHIMKHAVIVSGGNINTDFALDFLKKNTDENTLLIAADRGLEFFERTGFARKRTIRIPSRQPVLPWTEV